MLAAAGVASLAVFAGTCPAEDDPTIDGKAMSQWAKQLRSENRGLQMRAAQTLSAAPTNLHAAIIPLVVPVLKSERENDKFVAAQILGNYGPASRAAIPDLLPMLKGTQYERNRAAAAKALGQILKDAKPDKEVDEVTAALIETFKDGYEDVRREAVAACGTIGPAAKACIPHLTPRLTQEISGSGPNGVTVAAAGTCEKLGPLAREHADLLVSLMHKFGGYGSCFAAALGAIGPVNDNIVQNIMDEIEPSADHLRLAIEAYVALEKFGPKAAPAVPMLVRMLREGLPPALTIQAVKVFKAIGPAAAAAVPVLESYIAGKKEVNDYHFTPGLRGLTPEQMNELQRVCCEAIESITGKKADASKK